MANSKGRGGNSYKLYYANYNPEKQRRIRLERHLKKQPNDTQAQEAVKAPKARGPRKGNKLGWVDRKLPLYHDLKGPGDAKTRAWMGRIMKKAEAQHQHNLHYKPKAERQKGGNAAA